MDRCVAESKKASRVCRRTRPALGVMTAIGILLVMGTTGTGGAAESPQAPGVTGTPYASASALPAGPVLSTLPAIATQTPPAPGRIVRLVAVGMVLTEDGTIWVYRPDQRRWMTIDQSFQEEGQETRILPLPVRPQAIREMVTWGFLLTDAGECWLYQVDNHRWDRLPTPRR